MTDTFGLYNPDGAPADNKENWPKSSRSGGAPADRERHKRDVRFWRHIHARAPRTTLLISTRLYYPAEQLEEQRLRLTAAHDKDLAKLAAKLTKLESAKADWKRDRDESTKERDGLKSEIREF